MAKIYVWQVTETLWSRNDSGLTRRSSFLIGAADGSGEILEAM